MRFAGLWHITEMEMWDEERFYFTWEGADEMDPVSGSGWLRLIDQNNGEGKIKLHLGDSSLFWAKRVT